MRAIGCLALLAALLLLALPFFLVKSRS